VNDKKVLISIITVNLNNADGLMNTIESVRCQTYKNYEYIIIDGNSIDGSRNIIKRNKDIIFYSVSETDSGLFDAMNKGLEKSNGDFVLFLNSGDCFIDNNVLKDIINTIKKLDTVYFGCAKIINNKDSYYLFPNINSDETDIIKFLKYYRPNHQAILFPRNFYKTARYDLQYKIAGDEDYKIRAIKTCGYVFVNKVFVSFMLGGLSFPDSIEKFKRIINECTKIDKIHDMYSFRNHIRLLLNLFIKYLFKKLLDEKSYSTLIGYKNKRNNKKIFE